MAGAALARPRGRRAGDARDRADLGGRRLRAAIDGSGDTTYIGLRLGWLAILLVVSVFLALRAFGTYHRSI